MADLTGRSPFLISGEVVIFGPDRLKPIGAGATPIPGGTGPGPFPDLLVVTRSPGARSGAPTPPVTVAGPTNAKEWIFSKGETAWFMRYPKRGYDNSIAKWQ